MIPLPLTSLIRRADVLAEGLSDNDIRRARQRGVLTAVTPGVYLRHPEEQELDRAHRHRALLRAVLPGLTGDPVVSHESAALLHQLPILDMGTPVHVTRPRPAKSRRGPTVCAHRATLGADDIVTLGEFTVTSVARTVIDCALALPFVQAVRVAATAVRSAQAGPAELAVQLGRHAGIPGIRTAARVITVALADSGITPGITGPP